MPAYVAELVVRKKQHVVACWALAPGEYTLGASRKNHLRLDFRGVSARHARIIVREQEVLIEDLGSRYGTRRDGELIAGAVPFTSYRPAEIGNLRLEAVPRAATDLPAATLPPGTSLAGSATVKGRRPKPSPAAAQRCPALPIAPGNRQVPRRGVASIP